MPRKGGITEDFNPPADATRAQVVAALEANTAVLQGDVKSAIEELGVTAKQTHLGHEAYLWENEVKPEDVEEG